MCFPCHCALLDSKPPCAPPHARQGGGSNEMERDIEQAMLRIFPDIKERHEAFQEQQRQQQEEQQRREEAEEAERAAAAAAARGDGAEGGWGV